VKVVIISDTHGRHEELGILRGDVLIHCGDVCLGFDSFESELEAIDHWFSKQRFSAILCIGGNHDRPIEQRAAQERPVFENAIYLQDEAFEYGGFKFYGTPWVPYLYGWAYFQEDAILMKKWEQIPPDTDILITHTPPYQILDSTRYSEHLGDSHLAERVKKVRPKVHCFGHIHESYGQKQRNGTLFINASIVSRRGMNLPVTVDLE
jgi:Icc-related predicted phosphoesterase